MGLRANGSPIIFLDNFVGTDADGLFSTHLPDIDLGYPRYSWFPVSAGGINPNANISSNRLRMEDTGDGSARYVMIEFGIHDQLRFETVCQINSINGAFMGLSARWDGTDSYVFRVRDDNNQVELVRPDGLSVLTATLAIAGSDAFRLQMWLNGPQVVCRAVNLTSGVIAATIESLSDANRFATQHGLSMRTVFGGGASDFFDSYQVSLR